MAVKVKDIMNLRTVRRSHKQDLEQLHGQLRSVTPIPNSQNKGSLKHRCETQTIHNGEKKEKECCRKQKNRTVLPDDEAQEGCFSQGSS